MEKDGIEHTWPSPGVNPNKIIQREHKGGIERRSISETLPAYDEALGEAVMTVKMTTEADIAKACNRVRQRDLKENLAYSSTCLNLIIREIWECRVPPENCVIPPSILLLPLPVWDKESELIQMIVFALDANGDIAPIRRRNLEGIARLPDFPYESDSEDYVQNGPKFSEKVNLVSALVVFLEEMTGQRIGAEAGLNVNFLAAANMLRDMPFSSPWPTHPETFTYCDRPIVIGDIKIMEFRARLQSYFEQKQHERRGNVPVGSSINSIRFSTMPMSGKFGRVLTEPVTVPMTRSRFRDWRRKKII